MAANDLSFGSLVIYEDKALGAGSYGKVCKAKYGQLPCAAKLLHDIMFDGNDPGIRKYTARFEQECQFLSMIKHPNIVQYLGTYTYPQTGRLALLMEIMDKNLTGFLEQSHGPLSYYTQLNICHDVALALSYLHSNAIVHRDLSSNNVLLIGEGSRAKVADLGMSRLIDLTPCAPQLTQCPGNKAYMPPEALTSPPSYSNKLDCFSHGVLTIQIITKIFPHPGDTHKSVQDPNYPSGFCIKAPESERRKQDIDLIEPDHPLLPTALQCIRNEDQERPSADELCKRFDALKTERRYKRSGQQVEQASRVELLQKELLQCKTHHTDELKRKEEKFQASKAMVKSLHSENQNLLKKIETTKATVQSTLYQIFVKTSAGKTIPLHVQPSDTINSVKSRLQDKEGANLDQQHLLLQPADEPLKDDCTLSQYNIKKNDILFLRPKLIVIYVKISSRETISFQGDPTSTIEKVKNAIKEKRGIPLQQQRLLLAGRILEDGRTLLEYNVKNETTLHLELRYHDGMTIFVKTSNGKSFALKINPSDTVMSVRQHFQSRQHRLAFNGKLLEDGRTLVYYNIPKEAILHLVRC